MQSQGFATLSGLSRKGTPKSGVSSFIDDDKYWGEFSEENMDRVLSLMRSGNYGGAKEFIGTELRRTDFIFGMPRSDFLYYLKLGKDKVCLDVGCGLGVHTFNIARHAGKVFSFDQSLKRVEFCDLRRKLENVENVEVFHSDIGHLPFEGETFDNIVMNGVVEWVGEAHKHDDPRDDQIDALRAMRALLKPGGRLYIGIENRFAATYLRNARDHNRLKYTTFMPRFLADAVTRRMKGKPYRTYTYSIFGYRKLLKDSGFDAEKARFYIAHPGYNLPQYLIPFDDLAAIRFFFVAMSRNKGVAGKVLALLSKSNAFLRFARHWFYSYAIYADK